MIDPLFELLRSYAALVPPKTLSFPSNVTTADFHCYLLESILLDDHLRQYPPSKSYQHLFWKWAIDHLESQRDVDFEVDARIYEHYMSLLPKSPEFTVSHIQPPPQSFITYIWACTSSNGQNQRLYKSTTLLESRTIIGNGTTGMRTWPASFLLSQYIVFHPEIIAGKRVLELGCGVGLLGAVIASQQLCTSTSEAGIEQSAAYDHLCLTDVDERVLARCRENHRLPCNSLRTTNISYRILDWSNALDPAHLPHVESVLLHDVDPDIILGADLVYDPSLVPALISTIRLALQSRQQQDRKVAFMALTLRREDTLANFLNVAANRSLLVEDIHFEFDKYMFPATFSNGEGYGMKLFKIQLK